MTTRRDVGTGDLVQNTAMDAAAPPGSPLPFRLRCLLILLFLIGLAGCSSLIASATGDMAAELGQAMLDHDDPATVASAMPAYLVLLDSRARQNPDDPQLLQTAARLYGAYAGVFVNDPERRRRLAARALDYARRGACAWQERLCDLHTIPFGELATRLAALERADLPALYALGSAWAGWIEANTGDWTVIAELPRVKAIMQRVIALDETWQHGNAHLYLGVMASLVPPAMGGKPDEARTHFEKAIALAGGRNLTARVLYARYYARLVFDRALYTRELQAVLDADPRAPGLTLLNMLARQQARTLLAETDDYF